MVARLTPDQKVASSILVGVIDYFDVLLSHNLLFFCANILVHLVAEHNFALAKYFP